MSSIKKRRQQRGSVVSGLDFRNYRVQLGLIGEDYLNGLVSKMEDGVFVKWLKGELRRGLPVHLECDKCTLLVASLDDMDRLLKELGLWQASMAPDRA